MGKRDKRSIRACSVSDWPNTSYQAQSSTTTSIVYHLTFLDVCIDRCLCLFYIYFRS
jgi:hypothetical protein